MKPMLVTLALAALLPGLAAAQVTNTKQVLSLEGAKAVVAFAEGEAKRLGAGGAIAVVDDGGHVLAVERLEGTFPAAWSVSVGKARTAAQFRRPTSAFEDAIKNGRVSLTAVTEMVPLEGGVPLVVDGQVVGAIGVSGAMSADQDNQIALAAAAAFAGGKLAVAR
jgi:glc operon protein GlcG